MTVNANTIKGIAAGLFCPASATEQERAEHVFVRKYVEVDITDGGTAATAATERCIHRAKYAGRVVSAHWTPPVAIAANGATYFTTTLYKKTGAAASVAIGTIASSATSDVALVPREFAYTEANKKYLAGDVLTLAVTKASTGVAIASATAPARVSVIIEEDA